MDPDSDRRPADDDDPATRTGASCPGRSGNPRGRPPGSSRALHLARALAEAGVVAVVLTERPGTVHPAATVRRPRRPAT
jgi:hypothetical protein